MKSLEFTEVLYLPDDPLSLLLGVISLVPLFAFLMFVTLSVATGDKRWWVLVWLFLCDQLVNQVAKRIIQQPRPGSHASGYGMPSAHTECSFCVATWVVLVEPGRKRLIGALTRRAVFSLLIAAAVGWSRVYNGYHTQEQVIVGALVGITTCVIMRFVLRIPQALARAAWFVVQWMQLLWL